MTTNQRTKLDLKAILEEQDEEEATDELLRDFLGDEFYSDDGEGEEEDPDAQVAVYDGKTKEEFENEMRNFFRGLQGDIDDKHSPRPIAAPTAALKVTPLPFQLKAAGVVMRARFSRFKGLIYADPIGVGKTLSFLLAIHQGFTQGNGPCVIVVPEELGPQTMGEIENFFQKDELPAVLLEEDNFIAPMDLCRYRVVVTTYEYLVTECKRMGEFEDRLAEYERGETDVLPPNPDIALFSDVFAEDGNRSFGKYLILDDAHRLGHHNGVTFKVVKALRPRFETCITVTGIPFDDDWFDAYVLLSLLEGHPVTTPDRMLSLFSKTKLQRTVCVGASLQRAANKHASKSSWTL